MPRSCCHAHSRIVKEQDHGQLQHQYKGRDFAKPDARKHYAPHLILEPVHIEAHLRLDIPNKHVRGNVTTSVVCNSLASKESGYRSLEFDAVNFASVESVTDATETSSTSPSSDHDSSVSEWRYDGRKLYVTWASPFELDETRRISVTYHVREPITGLVFSSPDGHQPSRPLLVISDHETERARYWLPCVDNPAVRTTLRIQFEAPASLTALANGALESETLVEDGKYKRTIWSLSQRCPSYLICIAVGDFVRVDDGEVNGVPFSYFAAAATFSQDNLRTTFSATPEIQRWMVKKLSNPFPFPKYYQVAGPFVGGAMENISLTTWDDSFVMDETYAKEMRISTIDAINVHEMAHSYFGDSLVIRHFEHAWLKESWATYIEGCWLEDKHGQEFLEYELFQWANAYFGECNTYVRPIVTRTYDSSWNLFDRHLYPGGACRLHMLRRHLGDQIFWAAISDYLKTYQGELVDTDDFKKKLEKHSGYNLTAFFEEWVYGRGYPKLKGSFNYSAEKGEVKIGLEQTQKDDKKGVGVFEYLPIEVEIFEEDTGKKRVARAVFDEKGKASISFGGVTKKPAMIRIDPNNKLLFSLEFNPGLDLLSNALRDAPDVLTRIRAANELAKIGSRPALDVLLGRIETEKFFGVRVQIAAALSRHKTGLSIPILAKFLLAESDPLAQPEIASLCHFKDKTIASALREFLKKDDLGYFARSHALEGLGRQADPEQDREYLVAATQDKSFRHFVARGAYLGLGHLRDQKSFEVLLSAVEKGEDQEERLLFRQVGALANITAWQPPHLKKEGISVLRQMLRYPRQLVRNAAIIGLTSLGAAEAEEDIEAVKVLCPPQDHPWIDRQIAALRRAGDDSVSRLKTEIEKLNDRLKKLEENTARSD
eukprot:TRINITY_DN4575_c0_g1_i1.p1 TRINITY_DN4575_c0_g1~~TRINITY_DN4575_c0_g1_i1.p1  ORF type:complete len:885 (-),score=193.57 TRINITY_DN4575_c0_g1_i1:87-2741(-)